MLHFVSRSVHDPLLTATRIAVILLCGLTIFAMAMVGVGLLAALTFERAEILAKLAQAEASSSAYWTLIVVLIAIVAVLFASYRFFLNLWELIASLDDGNPFRAGNADRLSRMAWLTVVVQIIVLAISAPAMWLVTLARRIGEQASFDSGMGVGSVMLTLVLFVLARVFRHGAAMRDDLEGTV